MSLRFESVGTYRAYPPIGPSMRHTCESASHGVKATLQPRRTLTGEIRQSAIHDPQSTIIPRDVLMDFPKAVV